MARLSATAPAALVALALAGAARAAAAEPPETGGSLFDVEAYDVDGNSLLDQPTIEKAVYAHLGPARTRADVEGARQDLENAYAKRGFSSVVVEIPPQNVEDHIVRLHVVEASVGRLRVTGTHFYSPEDVKRGASALAEGAVPNLQQAQAQIAQLNREPGRQVTPLIRPGVIPGTVDVDLKVAEKSPFHAEFELNNDHAVDTSPLRTTATLRYDNLWQLGHAVSFSYAVAPQDRSESEVFAGSYLAPVPNSHWSILAYGYDSNSNVATLGSVTVLGKGYAAGVRGILQLPALGASVSESLSVGLDFKHFDQLIAAQTASNGAGGSKTSVSEAAIDYVPLNAVYTVRLDTAATTAHVSLGVTAGLRGAFSPDVEFQTNRAFAGGDFVHANLDFELTRELPLGAQADLRFTGQISDQPLVSGEQFSAGGFDSVRGYLQASATGDDGVFGSVELRSPEITFLNRHMIDAWRIYAFSEAAGAWLLEPLADQQASFRLYSAGVGTRFRLFDHLDGDVLAAVPLRRARGANTDSPYTQFSLKADF
ncbi:MAG TPA: ShlB/FhaC/HecB family hemolysin secretion/activation protein [Caulobacteraceae bacterium]|jgi:hemolysin activation/secretion protein|nr:ShlB/FhaC/HecB family hemolysin secretion/activation protein [Caulobacteraceae bacterium]